MRLDTLTRWRAIGAIFISVAALIGCPPEMSPPIDGSVGGSGDGSGNGNGNGGGSLPAIEISAAYMGDGSSPASIPERDGGPEIEIASLSAANADSGDLVDDVAYVITVPADSPFAIASANVVLPEGAPLDYEQIASYALTIRGAASNGTTADIMMTIPVTNLDDEAPVILPPPENITVIAGTSDLSSPVTIVANDDLGAEISYAFVDTTGAIVEPNAARLSLFDDFAIHADTGLITVHTAPVFSAATPGDNARTLTIQATDTSSGATGATTARAEIEIAVEPPNSIMVRSQAGNMITIAESDETPIAVTVIMIDTPGVTPAAVDPYTIQGSRSDFMVDANGAITANVDYDNLTESEQMNGINITVDVEGSTAGQSASITINVMVTNLDDEAPVILPPPENITVIAGTSDLSSPVTIVAADSADGALGNDAEITYAFVDTTGAIVEPNAARLSLFDDFAIHADTGLITVADAPDYSLTASENTRTLTIQAADTSSASDRSNHRQSGN